MPSPLISTADLAAQLNDPTLVIVDTRSDLMKPNFGSDAYASAHLPGAIFMSIEHDLAGKKTGTNGRHPLPTPEAFAQTLGEKGISNAHRVVVYDQGSSMFMGRLWWMLRWLGHSNAYVLDGGIAQWIKEARPTESTPRTRPATQFIPSPQRDHYLSADETLALIANPAKRIIDARAAERYRGETEPVDPVAGHIPGAANRPFALNLQDGTFKSPEVLRAEFETLLAGRKPQDIIHQCGSGVSALSNLIAMEHAGLSGSKLYAGSWSEWCADASRPVAQSA